MSGLSMEIYKLCLTICIVNYLFVATTSQGSEDGIQDEHEFEFHGKRYKAVFNQSTSQMGANSICQRKYNGSLASVTTKFLLDAMGGKLKEILRGRDVAQQFSTLWVCGRVDTQVDSVVIFDENVADLQSFQDGSNCAVLTNQNSRGSVYTLLSRPCVSEYHFLCLLGDRGSSCPEGVTSYERDIWFDDSTTNTRYIAVLHTHMSHSDSMRRCGSIGGATLANITTEENMHRVWQLLMTAVRGQHLFSVDEFWVGGTTNVPIHSSIDLTSGRILENGEYCILISNYAHSVGLYSKSCSDFGRRALCQLPVRGHAMGEVEGTHYLISLTTHMDMSGADDFCRVQYGGRLATKAQTQAAQPLYGAVLRGLLTNSVHNLWMGQNVIHTESHGDWTEYESSDCYGNDLSNANFQELDLCFQYCISQGSACVGVVYGVAGTVVNRCYAKSVCDNVTPHPHFKTYQRRTGGEEEQRCTAWKLSRQSLSLGSATFNYTKVPCAASLGFVCSVTPGSRAAYYYLGRCEDSFVTNVRYDMSSTDCALMGGAWVEGRCQLHLCPSSTRDVDGWLLTAPGQCLKQSVQLGMKMTRSSCRLLKGQVSSSIDAYFVNCSLHLCNKTSTPYLTYVISGTEECPVGHMRADVHVPVHVAACSALTGSTPPDAPQLGLLNYTLTHMWRPCALILCQQQQDCKTTQLGETYTGMLSQSVSGKRCLRWDEIDMVVTAEDLPENTTSEAENYCRNPMKWAEGPYCYTERPDTIELCNLPFCKGSGQQVETLQLDNKQYLLVPGVHSQPWRYCAQTFGAGAAIVYVSDVSDHLEGWLVHSLTARKLIGSKILVGGRVQSTQKGRIENDASIVLEGESGLCVYIRVVLNGVAGPEAMLFADDCATSEVKDFLCERQQVRIKNYQVEGGVPQMGIHNIEDCVIACTGECRAAGYDGLEESCWHYHGNTHAKPGRGTWAFTYVQKAPSSCHIALLGEDGVRLVASSSKQEEGVLHDVQQARLSARALLRGNVVLAGAWVPDPADTQPFIKVVMPRLYKVYGVISKGRVSISGNTSWVTNYNLSLSRDCHSYQPYDRTILANKSPYDEITIILQRAFVAQCLQIFPIAYNTEIALRFDVLVCRETQENVALGKLARLSSMHQQYGPALAVDGFLHADTQWGSCSVTAASIRPFYIVDLYHIYVVEAVLVQNRRHCCLGHLGQFSVMVGFSTLKTGLDASSYVPCVRVASSLAAGETLHAQCEPPITGRFVMLISDSDQSVHLAVCELEVYSSQAPVRDVALGKPSEQSQTYSAYTADFAVDGKLSEETGSCTHTATEERAWWRVQLQEQYRVHAVSITPRKYDRNDDLVIYVGEDMADSDLEVCSRIEGSFRQGETRTVLCEQHIEGSVVKLVKQKYGDLQLCEVQVYATPAEVHTYGGNGARAKCVFPFTYNDTEYDECTDAGRDRPWCAVSGNYTADSRWGYCMDVRLRGGRHAAEGRLEVRVLGKWQSVCHDQWDDTDARVVCRQLGYRGGVAAYPPTFQPGADQVLLGEFACVGGEAALMNCSHVYSESGSCTPDSEAGVHCHVSVGLNYNGYPVYARPQLDENTNATILIDDEIRVPGFVESWHFYASTPNTPVHLQVWRRMYDFKAERYMLVGESRVSANRTGAVSVRQPQHAVRVQPGDVIGLSFSGHNPVPYDYSFFCQHHSNVIYRKRAYARVGTIHTFYAKQEGRFTCRLYSLYVKIQTENIAHVHEFRYANYQYRVYLQRFSIDTADQICKQHMGSSSQLLTLTSLSQRTVVQNALVSMGVNGTFWVANKLNTSDAVVVKAEWAPCHPEKGKQCVAMANDNPDGAFLWYTKACSDQHFLICQFQVAPNEVTDRVPVYTAPPHMHAASTHAPPAATHNRITAIVIPIVLILIIAVIIILVVLLNRWAQKRRRATEYRVPNVSYRSSTADDEALFPDSVTDSEPASPRNISNPLYSDEATESVSDQ